MKTIQVQITEVDKGGRELSLLNLRDEIVNFLYRDTVASSTKTDQLFYLLFFFATVRYGDKALLEHVLDEAIPKLKTLNGKFKAHGRRLARGEYRRLVDESGLADVFKFDIFFILVEAISQIDEIEKKFGAFLKKHKKIKEVLDAVHKKYDGDVSELMKDFRSSEIADDRVDEHGNHLDLSKSVYRTVRMRNARNLNVNIQKYTNVQEITSKSPILLTFLQHIDPQIIFDLWEKYHVADYVSGFSSEFVKQIGEKVDTKISAGDLINGWLLWKMTREPNAKGKARNEFQKTMEKADNSEILQDLAETAVRSVMAADKHREEEIGKIQSRVSALEQASIAAQDKETITKLKLRISQLENLRVKAKIKEDQSKGVK